MGTTVDQPVRGEHTSSTAFAVGVERVVTVFVNAYLVGEAGEPWVLVDTGLPNFAWQIRSAIEHRFGRGHPPDAIVLTHGHFDHVGNVLELADYWDVPVYAHPLEMPFLTGRSSYPPVDPTVGGALGFMARVFPKRRLNLGKRVKPLPADGSIPGVGDWRWIHTPGHTPGHVSLFRDSDRVLLAGDALATLNQDSAIAMVTQGLKFSVPPAPLTIDWTQARESVERLAALEPWAVAAGHGLPAVGPHVAEDLQRFARRFTPPRRGRYVSEPARANETGIVYVPPAPPDPLPMRLAVAGLAAAAAWLVVRRRGNRE